MSRAAIEAGKSFVHLYLKDDLTKAIQTTMKNAGQAMQSAGQNLAKAGAVFGVAGGGILAPIVAGIKTFSDVGDQLDKMSQRTGVAASELGALKFAAEQSGSSIEQLEQALLHMQRKGMDPRRFNEFADAIAAIEDPVQRAMKAAEVFGTRAGPMILPMLGEFSRLTQQAHDSGIVPGNEEVKKAAELSSAINHVRKTIEATFFNIGAAMADDLLIVLDQIKTVTVAVSQWVKDHQKLVVSIAAVGTGLVALGGALAASGFALFGIGAGIKVAAGALGLLLSPLGLVTAAVVAGGVAFVRFTEIGKKAWAGLIAAVMPMVETFKTTFGGIADALKGGELELAGEIMMTGLELVVRQGIDALQGLFGGTITTIANQLLKGDLSGAWATVVDSMLVTWQSFKTATIEVFAGIVVSVKKMWNDMVSGLAARITEVAMEDSTRGAMWRKVIGYDPREDAKFGHAGMQAQLDREKKTLEQMEADMLDRGYVGTFAEHTAREEMGMPVMEAQLDQQRKIIAEQEALLREAGYVTREEIFDPVAEARRIAQESFGSMDEGFSGTMLRAAEEARQAERELIQAQRAAQEDPTEEANARVKQLEERLAMLRQRSADAAARPREQADPADQEGIGLVTAARPTGMANIGGMFRAAAIAAAGRGVTPEDKQLEELKAIRKAADKQEGGIRRLEMFVQRAGAGLVH